MMLKIQFCIRKKNILEYIQTEKKKIRYNIPQYYSIFDQ